MSVVELQCPAIVEDGDQCEYKTQKLLFDNAVQMMRLHKEMHHVGYRECQAAHGGACKSEEMTRIKADLEMSETVWRDFIGHWAPRSTKLQGQNLLGQLVLCCSDTLSLDLRSERINPMVHRNYLRILKQ